MTLRELAWLVLEKIETEDFRKWKELLTPEYQTFLDNVEQLALDVVYYEGDTD